MKIVRRLLPALLLWPLATLPAAAQKVIDLPTRPGVTQRFLLITPDSPKAAVVLFAGGGGSLNIRDNGDIPRGSNFLVRSRQLFADQGFAVAVVDTPSDRRDLNGFRQTPEHTADIRAVIAWMRENIKTPVWLVGTSRGTQSVGSAAVRLMDGGGPDGIVLTATILTDPRSTPVPEMKLDSLKIPVLVAHHEEDGCRYCLFRDMPRLMDKLAPVARKELMSFRGGDNQGDPCLAMAYHGFNGIESQVVAKISAWIAPKP